MPHEFKQLGVSQVRGIFDEVNLTEYTFSWLINMPKDWIFYYPDYLKAQSQSFAVKEEDEDHAYEYDWKLTFESSNGVYSLCMWLESVSCRHNADNKMLVSVSLADDSHIPLRELSTQNEPVDLFKVGKKIEAGIPFNILRSNRISYDLQFIMKIKIFWKENLRVCASQLFNQMSTDFEKLYIEQHSTDISFVFNNSKEIKAHKLILMARSPVFRTMFQSEMLECKENRVKIEDMDPDTFEELIRYIYSGKINATSADEVADIMVAADKYALNELKEYCEKKVKKNITIENAAENLIIAHLLNSDTLKTKVIDFIVSKKQEVLKTDGYKNLRKDHLHLIADLFEN